MFSRGIVLYISYEIMWSNVPELLVYPITEVNKSLSAMLRDVIIQFQFFN